MKDGGLIHIYCGDGKGKTTAAMGLSIRCAGHGNHVLIVQFLKSRPTGELASLALLPNIEVMRGKETKKFTFQMNDEEKADIKIKLTKSLIGSKKDQIATAHSLGLRKIGNVTVQPDNAQTQGKLTKIAHLVTIVEE